MFLAPTVKKQLEEVTWTPTLELNGMMFFEWSYHAWEISTLFNEIYRECSDIFSYTVHISCECTHSDLMIRKSDIRRWDIEEDNKGFTFVFFKRIPHFGLTRYSVVMWLNLISFHRRKSCLFKNRPKNISLGQKSWRLKVQEIDALGDKTWKWYIFS